MNIFITEKSTRVTKKIKEDFLFNTLFNVLLQNIVPKEEPVDSPLTDYSGENTNDTDIALLDDPVDKKFLVSSEILTGKLTHTTSNEQHLKKWINEVSSTQPGLNLCEKANGTDSLDDDKDSIEIDKEVETVLQSGTIVESLSITTGNLNSVSSEAQNCKGIDFHKCS